MTGFGALGELPLGDSGGARSNGSLNATLGDSALSAGGIARAIGTLAVTLADATLAATSTVAAKATASITLDDASLAALAAALAQGAADLSLADATVLASAANAPITGDATLTLSDASLSAVGGVSISGTASVTLASATIASGGKARATATVAVTLSNAVLFASALPPPGLAGFVQGFELDDEVVLYTLDATVVGGDIYRFTSTAFPDTEIVYGGEIFEPIPVDSDGWEVNGRGPLPSPTLRVSNVSRGFGAAVIAFNDLKGATVTRTRTFRRYLDGGPFSDPDAHQPLDVFLIDRKRTQNKQMIEWELAAPTDQQDTFLPKRPVLRNACTHRYRMWNGTEFDYTKATCPYAGGASFDASGASTDDAHDRCGKKLSDCKLRFNNDPLPTRAFPGVARTQGLT